MFSSKSTTPIDRQLSKKVVKIIHSLLMMEESAAFRKPVAHKALGLQDYKLIVKKPTDLNFIRRQNNEGKYKFVEEILDQIQLCWDNCKLYNAIGSEIYGQALYMEQAFDKLGNQVLSSFWKEINRQDYNEKFNQKKNDEEKQLKKNDNKIIKKVSYTNEVQVMDEGLKQKSRKNINSQVQSEQDSYEDEKRYLKKQQSQPMQAEINENNHEGGNIEKISMDIQDGQQVPEVTVQPIMINLNENPSRQQLELISNQMKQLYNAESFGLIEKVLEILHTNEKQQISLNKSGQMTFKMNKIHISTYHRMMKVLASEDTNNIIQ